MLHNIGGMELLKPESLLDDASSPFALLPRKLGTSDVGGIAGLRRANGRTIGVFVSPLLYSSTFSLFKFISYPRLPNDNQK